LKNIIFKASFKSLSGVHFKYLAIKNCEKTFLKNIQEIFKKRLKNRPHFDVLGRHYQVKGIRMNVLKILEKNNSSLKRGYTLNKEFSTDRVSLGVKARPQFLDE